MYEMTGARDYLVRVVAADLASFEAFLRGVVMRIPGVQSVEIRDGAEAGGVPHQPAGASTGKTP